MIRKITNVLLAGFFTLTAACAYGQQPHHPEITVGQKGLAQLKTDITYLLELTSKKDREQLVNLIDFIDIMAFGLDEERPLRIDIHSGHTPPTYMIWAPFSIFADLDENLDANFTKKKSANNLDEFLPPDQGWFRSLPAIKYAIMVLTNPADHALLKQLILKAGNPLPAIEELLNGNANLGIQLTNSATTKEDQQKRRESFAEVRTVRMDALQKRPTESRTEFAIRQGVVSNQLNELERLMVEASSASARFLLNKAGNSAEVLFTAEAIEETSFAKSLALFGSQPDAFGAIKRPEASVLSVRVNHPIDELRKGSANRVIDLLGKDVEAQLTQVNDAAEKEASRSVFNGTIEVARDSIGTGYVNAFMETITNDAGELISYGAISVSNGERLNETLPQIADTAKDNKIDVAFEKVGDVTFHRITFAEGYLKIFDKLFGAGKELYVGVSADLVWMGIGTESLAPLKAAIAEAGEPGETDVILHIEGNLLPWAKRAKTLLEQEPKPKSTDDKQKRRDNLVRLAQAVESFATDDEATFDMNVDYGKASGKIFLNTGVLRFIGKQIATFSRDTLE